MPDPLFRTFAPRPGGPAPSGPRTTARWLGRQALVIGLIFAVCLAAYLAYGLRQGRQVWRDSVIALPYDDFAAFKKNGFPPAFQARLVAVLDNDQDLAAIVGDQAQYRAVKLALAMPRFLNESLRPRYATLESRNGPITYVTGYTLHLPLDADVVGLAAQGLAKVFGVQAALLMAEDAVRARLEAMPAVRQSALEEQWNLKKFNTFSLSDAAVFESLAGCDKLAEGPLRETCRKELAETVGRSLADKKVRDKMLADLARLFAELPRLTGSLNDLAARLASTFAPQPFAAVRDQAKTLRQDIGSTYALSLLEQLDTELDYIAARAHLNTAAPVTSEPAAPLLAPRKIAVVGVAALACAILGAAFIDWVRTMRRSARDRHEQAPPPQ